MQESGRTRFYIDKTGFFAESAMIFFALAIVFRVLGCFTMWGNRVDFIMLLLLPACCCLLMILCILLLGKKGFFLSFIPVLLGVVFFVFKSLSFTSWLHTVLCVILYLTVAVIYTATVIGWIHTKWLLPPLFALPFLYHVFVEDIPALTDTAHPVTFAAGMQELSVLAVMAALFCVGMGLKKRPPRQKKSRKKEEEPPITEFIPANAPAESTPAFIRPADPMPAQPAAPAPAPVQPAAPAPAAEPAPSEEAPSEEPVVSDVPYTPSLTLDPEPWDPAGDSVNKPDGGDNE